ncbi:MAG: LysR family transcriptional regulator [Polyangia bacterium]
MLLAERHVSRAAERAGITQPSMSRVLAAAREIFADQLLVTTRGGARLTVRGEQLREQVAAVLRQVDAASSAAVFAPERARGVLKLAVTDYAAQVYLPPLVGRLRTLAPRVTLEVSSWSADALTRIERNEVHLGLNPLEADAPRGFYRRSVGRDRYVVAMSETHRLATKKGLDLREFLGVSHVLTAPEGGRVGVVDRALRGKRKERTVGARVQDFATALALASASDMLVTVPERMALRLREPLRLVLRDAPVALPAIEIDLIWHEGTHRDPFLTWVRSVIPAGGEAASAARRGRMRPPASA